MITPGSMMFLRGLLNFLLLSVLAVVVSLLVLKLLGQDYHADEKYEKLKQTIAKYSIVRFTAICLILALAFATNFSFTELVGNSMEPNFWEGQLVLVRHNRYKLERGDLVIIRLDEETDILKRLIGMPGDLIHMPEEGGIIVNWETLDETSYISQTTENEFEIKMTVPEGEIFVLGDNREDSYDSRYHGGFSKDDVLGKVVLELGSPPQSLLKMWHEMD